MKRIQSNEILKRKIKEKKKQIIAIGCKMGVDWKGWSPMDQ